MDSLAVAEYYGLSVKAEALPVVAPIKAPSGKAKVIPTFLGGAKGATVSNTVSNITNLDLTSHVRDEGTMAEVIKKLVLTSPDLSHAVDTKIRSAISKNFTAIARDDLGRVDPAATEIFVSLIQRMNVGSIDYTKFNPQTNLRSVAASLLLDSSRYGGMCLETVLDKSRAPAYLNPVASRLLTWADATPVAYPIYKGPDGDVELNFPTIFYSSTIQDQETAYAESPLQTAIQACMWDAEFANDLRRAATKNLLQRMKVVISSEKYMKMLPEEVKHDAKKQTEYMDALVVKLESQLAALEPDDSLVIFDHLEADTIADANRSEDKSITVLQALVNGKISSGAKILPSVIGRGENAGAASTESLLFLKSIAHGQLELNNILSRAFTFCLRLLGFDVYAHFEFAEVNLRPELELETFKAVRLSSTLQLLSVGFLQDIEASIITTGTLPPAGHKDLSGTMFYTAASAEGGNDYSNTSATTSAKPNSTQSQKQTENNKSGVKSK